MALVYFLWPFDGDAISAIENQVSLQRELTTPDSPKGFNDNTHTQAPRDTRACPSHRTLTYCAPHAHPLLFTAMAFVPYGFVLKKRALACAGSHNAVPVAVR
jgi:hypothetical protein